jgi:hypothetical protein
LGQNLKQRIKKWWQKNVAQKMVKKYEEEVYQ